MSVAKTTITVTVIGRCHRWLTVKVAVGKTHPKPSTRFGMQRGARRAAPCVEVITSSSPVRRRSLAEGQGPYRDVIVDLTGAL